MTPSELLGLVLGRPALLRGSRLVCIDGPAGSGKTTLASGLLTAASAAGLGAALVHMDDLYAGWSGRDAGIAQARAVVAALDAGEVAGYARYDWHAGKYAEHHVVPPADLVVIEGVGAADAAYAAVTTLAVWVDAPPEVRLRRGLARDGEAMREHWVRWMAEEERHHTMQRTRERADLLLDTTAPG